MAKVQRVISQWATDQYGDPSAMCTQGQAVYNIIIGLEDKGKTPAEIVAFFERRNKAAIPSFVVNRLVEIAEDEAPNYDDHIYSLEKVLDSDGNSYVDDALHSTEFKAALKAEIKRIKKLGIVDMSQFKGTPVFIQKRNGDIEVTFKKKRK